MPEPACDPLGRRWIRSIVLFELLLAGFLGILLLGRKSLWYDEALSVAVVRDWGQMWDAMLHSEANMWLYYLLLHFWIKLGDSEFAARSLSVVFAVATVPLMVALGKRLFGWRVGALAGLLLALNAWFIHYAQEARSYSLLVLLATLASYFFVMALERRFAGCWIAYGATVMLGAYAHFFALLVPVAHAASLAFLPRRDIPWKGLAVAAASAVPLLLALISFVPLGGGGIAWIQPVRPRDVVTLFSAMSGSRPGLVVYGLLCLVAVGAGVVRPRRFKPSAETWRYAFVLLWLLVPVAIILCFSILVKPLFVARYLIICLPPLVMLVAVGLCGMNNPWLFRATLAAALACSAYGLFLWYARYEKEAWREVTTAVIADARPGDAVLFYAYYAAVPFEYYRNKLGAENAPPAIVELASRQYPRFGADYMPDPDVNRLDRLKDAHPRVWLVLSHATSSSAELNAQRSLIQSCLARYYTVTQDRSFVSIRVLLYERALDRSPRAARDHGGSRAGETGGVLALDEGSEP